uniref:RING-type domain-containing protein n=1 Tax=Hyaloperonospora arabidopsidis (strain Emoy2) TaxID=559515 RepID=M4B6Y8_HYAAE
MGQHCSCLDHTHKYQRRQSHVDTLDMERGDSDDDEDDEDEGDQELELLRLRNKAEFGGRSSQRGVLKRVGSAYTSELVLDGGEEEKGPEELHVRRDSDMEWVHWDVNRHVLPFSRPDDLLRLLQSYQEATGVDDPKVRTLCMCGINRTNFHMSCLLEWLNRDANCPVCRKYLYFEDA